MKAEWRKWRGGRAAGGDWRRVVTILLTVTFSLAVSLSVSLAVSIFAWGHCQCDVTTVVTLLFFINSPSPGRLGGNEARNHPCSSCCVFLIFLPAKILNIVIIFKMQPKIVVMLVLGTPEHLELGHLLQNWPFTLHFNFCFHAQGKTVQNGPKSTPFQI